MSFATFLSNLPPAQRAVLLGLDTDDPQHAAFPAKRVVHAGLLGSPVPKQNEQTVWLKAMEETADRRRDYAIYVHIPFCQTRCLYCGFYQHATRQEVEDDYVQQLVAEIKRDTAFPQLKTATISSIFIGGGTPTSLTPTNVSSVLNALRDNLNLAADCEITLEGRIHDVVPEKIAAWLAGGVNRISLGVQSFDTQIRRYVGRIDDRETVLARLKNLLAHDVTVIVDLIYGLPGQDMAKWLEDVATLEESGVHGMDLYQLNIFPGGNLEKAVQKGTVPPCADIAGQADMYGAAREYLLGRGYERLSLCHWRKDKREGSRYNSMAKSGAVVYPFGCGAGGNVSGLSFMLERHLDPYMEAMQRGQKPFMMMAHQVEPHLQHLSNQIIDNLERGYLHFGELLRQEPRLQEVRQVLAHWEENGLMTHTGSDYTLTPIGEFWYINMTQSLLECSQAIVEDTIENLSPVQEGNTSGDPLDEVIAELMPQADSAARQAMVKKIPTPVRMMLKRSSKDSLKKMLAGLPPSMLERMMSKAMG
ncbi:MAG: heme anaerobic degradation radical SAM methyltransferase ChuW/HutW [Selenomonadaceae bacterium]|nr:heme anaerobic degradation radical SAM methyltransferase ChuW/HutW [Selenomonadaceae bacterium]